jgi:hypothetical protein
LCKFCFVCRSKTHFHAFKTRENAEGRNDCVY